LRLLVIGELNQQLSVASNIAIKAGAKVRQVPSIEGALNLLRSAGGADLIIIDVCQDIKGLIDKLTTEHIVIPVVAAGFDHNTDEAVNAIKAGAKEYLSLPPDEELIAAILSHLTHESKMIMGTSKVMKNIYALIAKVAPSNANILITGESGTGKEVFSRYLHAQSRRADKPFISLNCAAIPDNLLESELFGHEKGAFTGAINRRIGKFEEANTGTLLLDEISEIDIRLQAKLLRAIQEQEIERVGGSNVIKLNLRIIATSNRQLKMEVAAGRFREDLYFRLNIINIHLPALRERKEDILAIADNFIKKYCHNNALAIKNLSVEAQEVLLAHPWPGNVRELENTIHRAVLLAEQEIISPDALMLNTNEQTSQLVGRKMQDVEKELVLSTLDWCAGDRLHAANVLGISIKTLKSKLEAYS
jgi:two-component system, response regulator FlrC